MSSAWMPNPQILSTVEFLEIEFSSNDKIVLEVEICENNYSGAIRKIQLGYLKSSNDWTTIWEGIPYISPTPRHFKCPVSLCRPSRLMRIEFEFNNPYDKNNYQISGVAMLNTGKNYQMNKLTTTPMKDFSDMKFIVGKQEFPSHKIMIAMKLNQKPTSIKDSYVIDLEPEKFAIFYEYLYSTDTFLYFPDHYEIFNKVFSHFNMEIKPPKEEK